MWPEVAVRPVQIALVITPYESIIVFTQAVTIYINQQGLRRKALVCNLNTFIRKLFRKK